MKFVNCRHQTPGLVQDHLDVLSEEVLVTGSNPMFIADASEARHVSNGHLRCLQYQTLRQRHPMAYRDLLLTGYGLGFDFSIPLQRHCSPSISCY